jgi:hypothetical protein
LELPSGDADSPAAQVPAEPAKPSGPGPRGQFGGGLFAEKLKVALKKKREEPIEIEDPDKQPETP